MTAAISFSHIVNPFLAPEGSEHSIASRITFASLRRAVHEARTAGLDVEVRAVVLSGDEGAIEPPAIQGMPLTRTVQQIRELHPVRPLPLISDILIQGSTGATGEYIVFTNMDIAVQPNFYIGLRDLIANRFGPFTPFVVYRRNIDVRFSRADQLAEMYGAEGTVGYGFDCFVFNLRYIGELDLGNCCIGSAHFDNLLFMGLDAASGFRMGRVRDIPLTFHIGNEIGWTRHMDYIEHNLTECMAAIKRMEARYNVPRGSSFSSMARNHFRPNARIDSALFRRLKRLPGVGVAAHRIKKWLGRGH
jgi:hypothetical protein